MANTPVRGEDAMRVQPRKGAAGEVTLAVGVHPRIKDEIVDLAELQGLTIKELVVAALSVYIADWNRRLE